MKPIVNLNAAIAHIMRVLRFILAVVAPGSGQAQILTGTARVIDGDTLEVGTERIRLHGIDAVELSQTCTRNGENWRCGEDAAALMRTFADGKPVARRQHDTDKYDRIVATCEVGWRDLGAMMIEAGQAVALPQFSQTYLESEAMAKRRHLGIWGSTFELPADYRAAHPQAYRPPAKPKSVTTQDMRPVRPDTVYYRNCAAARAAEAAPIYRGQPGYRPEMDGDNDGIACEPYRGRR